MERFAQDKRYAKACEIPDEGFEDAFQYAVVGKCRLVSKYEPLERLNQS